MKLAGGGAAARGARSVATLPDPSTLPDFKELSAEETVMKGSSTNAVVITVVRSCATETSVFDCTIWWIPILL